MTDAAIEIPTTVDGWAAWTSTVSASDWTGHEKAAALSYAAQKIARTAWNAPVRERARDLAAAVRLDADRLQDAGADPLTGLDSLVARGVVSLANRP